MKLLNILIVTTFFLGSCSTNSTGPEEQQGQLNVNSLAIRSPNEVFVNTSEGLFKSSDNGETWKSLNNYRSGLISISPSGIIYCARYSKTGTYTSEETLWRSTDGGNTFNMTRWVYEISADGLIAIAFNNQEHIFAWKQFTGIYRSTNQGANWDQISYGIINAEPFISPDDLFSARMNGIYRSEDNGDNWSKVLELKDITGDTSYSYNALAFNSTHRIFAGINAWHFLGDSVETGMIYYSDDNGESWLKSSALKSDITHITINSEDNIFVITELNEILISADNGVNWNLVRTIFPDASIKTLRVNSNNYLFINIITGETLASQIYRSMNDGMSWERIWPHN